MPKRKMRKSSFKRRQGANLNTDAIKARGSCTDIATMNPGKKQPAIASIGLTTTFGRNWFFKRKTPFKHSFSSFKISINMGRRKRKHGTYAVETMPAGIFIKGSGKIHIIINAKQIINRIAIFITT